MENTLSQKDKEDIVTLLASQLRTSKNEEHNINNTDKNNHVIKSSEKTIIIDLDNIRARKIQENDKEHTKNHFYLEEYFERIKELIEVRIREVEEDDHKGLKDFLKYRMNDSILIYGTRGNGKSTIMVNLKEKLDTLFDKENKRIKVLSTIDPTVLEPNEDFLLIILSTIMKAVERFHKNETEADEHLRERFYHLLEDILKKIESARPDGEKSEIFDRFFGDKTGVGLAKKLHELFYITINIFGVKALLLPIDDIDMNMLQGYSIAETIRKYLASPYIIPIVTFNLKQMRAIAKYNKYNAFGLELTDKEIENYDDLDFLYSIPSDYLASVFPPDRRIFLKSIFDVLKHYEENKDEEIRFFLSSLAKKCSNSEHKHKSCSVQYKIVLKIILNIIFEYNLEKNFYKTRASDYLGNRSIRDFLKDCQSVMESIIVNESRINYEVLLNRFSPDNRTILVTKEQALSYLWHEFLKLAKKNILKQKESDIVTKNNWPKLISEIMYDDYSEAVNKKAYTRLWLQQYYINQKKTKITDNFNNVDLAQIENENLKITKSYNLAGALELALKSYIPMYIFEMVIKNDNIEYSTYDMINLKEIAIKDLVDVAYDLSVMELMLKRKKLNETKANLSKYKLFGSVVISLKKNEILSAKYNIPFLFRLKNQDQIFESEDYISHQIYFLSIFKAIALFVELTKLQENKIPTDKLPEEEKEKYKKQETKKLHSLLEKYRVNLPCLNNNNFVQNYREKNFSLEDLENNLKHILGLEFSQSRFGILEVTKFSKRLVEYFFEIRANTNLGFSFSEINLKKHNWFCSTKEKELSREKSCFICDKLRPENKYYVENIEDVDKDISKRCFSIKENSNSRIYKEQDYSEIIEKENKIMVEEIGTLSEYFDYPLSSYLTAFSQSILISLIKSNDNLKEYDIFTRNSIHGANLTLLRKNYEYFDKKELNGYLNEHYDLYNIEKINTYEKLSEIFSKLKIIKWYTDKKQLNLINYQYYFNKSSENSIYYLSKSSSFFFLNINYLFSEFINSLFEKFKYEKKDEKEKIEKQEKKLNEYISSGISENKIKIMNGSNIFIELFIYLENKECIEDKDKNHSLYSICKFISIIYKIPFFEILFNNYKNIKPTECCNYVTNRDIQDESKAIIKEC